MVCSPPQVSFCHHLLPCMIPHPPTSPLWQSPCHWLCPLVFSLFSLFCSVPLPAPPRPSIPPLTAVSLFSVYESVSILLASLFHSEKDKCHINLIFTEKILLALNIKHWLSKNSYKRVSKQSLSIFWMCIIFKWCFFLKYLVEFTKKYVPEIFC